MESSHNGLSAQSVAHTAYTVWATCSGLPDQWDKTDQEAWIHLAHNAIRLIDGSIQSESQISAVTLARTLYSWFADDRTKDKFTVVDDRTKLIWEAIGRHLVNCLDSAPGSVTLSEYEIKWPSWIERRLTKQGATA